MYKIIGDILKSQQYTLQIISEAKIIRGRTMKRVYLLSIILVLVIAFFSTGYGNTTENITLSISGKVLDLQNQPVKDAKVILKNPIGSDRIAFPDDMGAFSFSKLQIEKDKNVSFVVNATGYLDWKNTMKPAGDVILYVNLVPMQDNLALILLLPAMLGLIAWVSIKLSPKWGKWLSILMLLMYSVALSIWFLSTRNLVSLPADITRETTTLIQTHQAGATILIILIAGAFFIIKYDLSTKITSSLKGNSTSGGTTPASDNTNCMLERIKDLQRSSANCFASTATGLWILSLIGLIYGYTLFGNSSIAIFQPDLSVPLLVPIFAFLGVLVYSTANIRESADISEDSSASRKKIIVLGERILIGPYIALVAYLVLLGPILKSTDMGTSPATAFLAFFTGLYVKQVMDRLDQIGVSMLTTESQEKIKLREEEKDELVDSLGIGSSLAQALKNINITSIDDLSGLSEEKIKKNVKDHAIISKAQLHGCHEMARLYKKEIKALRDILSLDSNKIDILESNQIASVQQIASEKLDSLLKLTCLGNDGESIKNLKSKAEAVTKLEDICNLINKDKDTLPLLKNISITDFKKLGELGNLKKDPDAMKVIEGISKYAPEGKQMLKDKIISIEDIFDPSTETTNAGVKTYDTETRISITENAKNKFNGLNIKKYGDIPLQFIKNYKEPPKTDILSNNKKLEDILGEMVISDVLEYFSP